MERGNWFSTSLPVLIIYAFDYNHPDGWKILIVVLICIFLITSDVESLCDYWPFVYIWRNVSIFQLDCLFLVSCKVYVYTHVYTHTYHIHSRYTALVSYIFGNIFSQAMGIFFTFYISVSIQRTLILNSNSLSLLSLYFRVSCLRRFSLT
jgi:hypothetical protein